MTIQEPHECKGAFNFCMKCYRPRMDAIHSPGVSVVRDNYSNPGIDQSNLVPTLDVFNEPDIKNFEIFKPIQADIDPGPIPGDFEIAEKQPVQTDQKACKGHTCSNCGTIWNHDYDCSSREHYESLCEKCAGNAAVEVGRPLDLKVIAANQSSRMTGQEYVDIVNQQDQTFWDMTHKADGSDREDWEEKALTHYDTLQRMLEQLKIRIGRQSKNIQDKRTENFQKLTKAEQEQYVKDSRKRSGGGKVKTEKAAKTEPAKAGEKKLDAAKTRQDLLDSISADVRSKRPTLSSEQVAKIAQKLYDIQKAAEDEA